MRKKHELIYLPRFPDGLNFKFSLGLIPYN